MIVKFVIFIIIIVYIVLLIDQCRGSIMITFLNGVTTYRRVNHDKQLNCIEAHQTAVFMFHGFGDTSDGKTIKSLGFPSDDYWFYCYQYNCQKTISYWLKDIYKKYQKVASVAKKVILWGLSFGGWFVLAVAQYIYKQTGRSLQVFSIAPFSHWRDLVYMPPFIHSNHIYGNITFNTFHRNWFILASKGDEIIDYRAIERHYGPHMNITFTTNNYLHNDIVNSKDYNRWIKTNFF